MTTTPANCEPGLEGRTSSRIGLIVPSSNTAMETELPELFRRQSSMTGDSYTFHSARAAMKHVNTEELLAMVGKASECSAAVSDADVDVIAYACLVAVMAQGPGAHRASEEAIAKAAADNGHSAAVVSSAGALVRALGQLGARRVAIVTPYVPALTKLVCDYIEGEGISVIDSVALGVADNLAVGRLDTAQLPQLARDLDRDGVDAIVLSACVQMPSLAAVQVVEDELGLPVITAATATAFEVLTSLGHTPTVASAGALLRGTAVRP